jgi:hypothetical protein
MLGIMAAPLWADDRDTALAIIDAAIKAQGGSDSIAKTQPIIRTVTGQMTVADKPVSFTEQLTARWPDQLRREMEIKQGEVTQRVILVLGGEKGWHLAGGTTGEMTSQRVQELRDDGLAQQVATLLPLRKDTSFGLAPLPEMKIDGKPTLGVRVSRKGMNDIQLFFDKETHLLIRMTRRASEAGSAVDKEETYADYKEFDGVKLPIRIVQSVGGKKVLEISEATYKFPGKLEDAIFGRP